MAVSSIPKNRLKEYRDRARLTMEEVSLLTGYTVPTISRHESGERGPTDEAIEKYSALYKEPSHKLFVL